MPSYGCPHCGHTEAKQYVTEYHRIEGEFDDEGGFLEDIDNCVETDPSSEYICMNCNRRFYDPEPICPQCDNPHSICICEKCSECGATIEECCCPGCAECHEQPLDCTCDHGYTRPVQHGKITLHGVKVSQVNPMAQFASEQVKV